MKITSKATICCDSPYRYHIRLYRIRVYGSFWMWWRNCCPIAENIFNAHTICLYNRIIRKTRFDTVEIVWCAMSTERAKNNTDDEWQFAWIFVYYLPAWHTSCPRTTNSSKKNILFRRPNGMCGANLPRFTSTIRICVDESKKATKEMMNLIKIEYNEYCSGPNISRSSVCAAAVCRTASTNEMKTCTTYFLKWTVRHPAMLRASKI